MTPHVRCLEPDDLSKLVYVSDPQISPDGAHVAFVVVRSDVRENKYLHEIWVVSADDVSQEMFLAGEGDSWPRWSCDSRRLLFLSRRGFKDEEKGNAIYVVSVRGGEPRLVLKRRYGIRQPVWSPREDLIAFIGPDPRWRIDEDEDFVEARDLPAWFNGVGFRDHLHDNLYLVDPNSGHVKKLAGPYRSIVHASFSNKGDKVAFVAVTDWRRPLISDVFMVDLARPGEPVKLTKSSMHILAVEWSPDDEYLLLHGNALPRGLASHNHVWVMPSDGSEAPVCLTGDLDRNVGAPVSSDSLGPNVVISHPQWAADGNIYFQLNEGGRVNLYKLNPETRLLGRVSRGDHVVYSFSLSKASPMRIAYLKATATRPPDVYVIDESGERRLTAFNEPLLSEVYVAEPEHLRFRASDGVCVDGWAIPPRPTGDSGKHPVVLFVHGGPKASYGYSFNFLHQLLAGMGYWVVYFNPRGSDGYSEEFADIRGRYGERDYMDVIEGVKHFLEGHETADPERMAVTGISYGGFMTNWIITRTSMFKAAISENGIADWAADYYTSDIGFFFNPDQISGTPWGNPEAYRRASPLTYVDNVETPVLIIHSMEDYRCYVDQAIAFHVALRVRGKESRLVMFLKGDHGHSVRGKPRQRVKRLKVILGFLEEKLKPGKAVTA